MRDYLAREEKAKTPAISRRAKGPPAWTLKGVKARSQLRGERAN